MYESLYDQRPTKIRTDKVPKNKLRKSKKVLYNINKKKGK